MLCLSAGPRTRLLHLAMLTVVLALSSLVAPAEAATRARISGTVTDAQDAPLRGILVEASYFDEERGSWVSAGGARTRRDGTYTIRRLPAGDFQVRFADLDDVHVDEYYDGAHLDTDATLVSLSDGEEVTGVDAALEPGAVLGGAVTDEEGNPLEDVIVDSMREIDGEWWFVGSAVTNAAGEWELRGKEAATYRFGFSIGDGSHVTEYWNDQPSLFEGDDVTVGVGEVRDDLDAQLAVGGRLQGTVTEPDGITPIPDIAISIARLVDGEWTFYGNGDFAGFTDEAGHFDIGGVPAGTYRIEFVDAYVGDHLAEHYDDVRVFDDAEPVEVATGETVAGLDASLDPAGTISGRVTDEEGNPLEGVSVWARDDAVDWSGSAETAVDGTYEVTGLRAGSYTVEFRDPEGAFAREYHDDAIDLAAADPVDVSLGQDRSGIDADLAAAARLQGHVTAAAGQDELRFFGVTAYRLGSDGSRDAVGEDFVEHGTAYDIGGLPPGTYRLLIDGSFSDEMIDAEEWYDDVPTFSLAEDIVITEAGELLTGYDAELVKGDYPGELVNLTPPTITGAPVVNQVLTAASGTWTYDDAAFAYQWRADGAPVGTAAPTYSPTAADVGKQITVDVTASLPGFDDASATSAPTAPVAAAAVLSAPGTPASPAVKIANLRLPTIRGGLEVGQEVRVTAGRWTPGGVTLRYRWYAGGDPVRGAREKTLVIKPRLEGERLRVRVTARAAGAQPVVVRTARSARIAS